MKDYYLILKVSRDATTEDIRRAHRRLALRYHPDRSTEPDPDKFREVQEAYEVLRDREKRKAYNDKLKAHEGRFRAPPEPVHAGPIPMWEDFGTVMPGLEEILDHLRRNFFGPPRKVDPLRDLNVEFVLDPDEAACGGSVPLEVPLYQPCPACGGRGGAFPFPCLRCDGTGWVWHERSIQVHIPPGIRDGTTLQIPLQHLGIKNLYLNVHIRIEPY